MKSLATLVILSVVGGVWGGRAPQAEAVVLINEVLANPGGLDANQDGTADSSDDEFIELANPASLPLSLSGWSLRDAVRMRHVFDGSANIPGFGFFVVFGGGTPAGFTHAATASTGLLGLNNDGDTISLLDPTSVILDTFTYTQALNGISVTRFPDAEGSFVSHRTVSPLAFSPSSATTGATSLARPELSLNPESSPIVPEPPPWLLVGVGLLGLAWRRRTLTL